MFSFIRRFFENCRKKAAERDRLCEQLFQKVTNVLLVYIDIDKSDKASINKWLTDYENLYGELNDIGMFKKSPSYELLKHHKKTFDEYRTDAFEKILSINLKEKQKRADDEYVAKKLNQWVSEQKLLKVEISKPKNLSRKLKKLTVHSDRAVIEIEGCTCCGKDGKKKNLYPTEDDAMSVAAWRSQVLKKPLRVYWCPYGKGYHITSNVDL